MATQEDDLLDPVEAARLCRCSRSTIYANKDRIPHYRISAKEEGAGKILFKKSDLLRWLESCRVEA